MSCCTKTNCIKSADLTVINGNAIDSQPHKKAKSDGAAHIRQDKVKGHSQDYENYRKQASGFVALRRDPPTRKATAGQAKVEFCKANKRGSEPLFSTERFAAARLESCHDFACVR